MLKIKDLEQPYRQLAEMRSDKHFYEDISLDGAFTWDYTPEGREFWEKVKYGQKPPLPAESVMELNYNKQTIFIAGYEVKINPHSIDIGCENIPEYFIYKLGKFIDRYELKIYLEGKDITEGMNKLAKQIKD